MPSRQNHSSVVPPLAEYQTRVIKGATKSLDEGRDVLVEAPTGSGKTAILAGIARRAAESGGKALILTHRKALFRQMAGARSGGSLRNPADPGEIARWSGIQPGTFGEPALGGIDQQPGIVVGMVETVGARLVDLAEYSVVLIDETHHASSESENRVARGEINGAYARVIDAMPQDTRVVGVTATPFRGNRDRLIDRLEEAAVQVVSVEEARATRRIVPPRTHIGRARLACGRTPWQVVEQHEAGLESEAPTTLVRDGRNDAFYETVARDWTDVAGRRPMIVFTDRTADVDRMVATFEKIYGPGAAVGLHGRRGAAENDRAIEDYKAGRAGVLISCKMIEEGFDVPDTDVVASVNASLSRAQMNQYVGRALRVPKGGLQKDGQPKTEGLFLDYGTATYWHGPIEAQHEIQNINAWAAAGTRVSAARAINAAMPVEREIGGYHWRVLPGEKSSLFLAEVAPGSFLAYELDHKAHLDLDRRPGRNGPLGRLTQVPTRSGSRVVPHDAMSAAGAIVERLRDDAGYASRAGGLDSTKMRDAAAALLGSWEAELRTISQTHARYNPGRAPERSEAEMRRAEVVRREIRGEGSGAGSWLLSKAMAEAKPGARLRESVRLLGVAVAEIAKLENTPSGLRGEMAFLGAAVAGTDFAGMKPAEVNVEGRAMEAYVDRVAGHHPALPGTPVVTMLRTTLAETRQEMRKAARARKVGDRIRG